MIDTLALIFCAGTLAWCASVFGRAALDNHRKAQARNRRHAAATRRLS